MRKIYELKVSSITSNLQRISDFLWNILRKEGLSTDIIDEILIAVDEAATNIILHSYKSDPNGYIRLKLEINSKKVIVSLYDNGITFDPDKVKPPNLAKNLDDRELGGLGIFLMKKFMDEVTFYLKDMNTRKENEVRMVKYLKNKMSYKEV